MPNPVAAFGDNIDVLSQYFGGGGFGGGPGFGGGGTGTRFRGDGMHLLQKSLGLGRPGGGGVIKNQEPAFDPAAVSPLLGGKGGIDPGIDYNELFPLATPIQIQQGAPPQVGAGANIAQGIPGAAGLLGGLLGGF